MSTATKKAKGTPHPCANQEPKKGMPSLDDVGHGEAAGTTNVAPKSPPGVPGPCNTSSHLKRCSKNRTACVRDHMSTPQQVASKKSKRCKSTTQTHGTSRRFGDDEQSWHSHGDVGQWSPLPKPRRRQSRRFLAAVPAATSSVAQDHKRGVPRICTCAAGPACTTWFVHLITNSSSRRLFKLFHHLIYSRCIPLLFCAASPFSAWPSRGHLRLLYVGHPVHLGSALRCDTRTRLRRKARSQRARRLFFFWNNKCLRGTSLVPCAPMPRKREGTLKSEPASSPSKPVVRKIAKSTAVLRPPTHSRTWRFTSDWLLFAPLEALWRRSCLATIRAGDACSSPKCRT